MDVFTNLRNECIIHLEIFRIEKNLNDIMEESMWVLKKVLKRYLMIIEDKY